MMKVTARTRADGVWVDLPIPEALTDQIALLKSLYDTESVFKLEIVIPGGGVTIFYCCKQELVPVLEKNFPNASVQIAQDAMNMVDYAPEHYYAYIRTFCFKEDKEVLFPDMPPVELPSEEKIAWWKTKREGRL